MSKQFLKQNASFLPYFFLQFYWPIKKMWCVSVVLMYQNKNDFHLLFYFYERIFPPNKKKRAPKHKKCLACICCWLNTAWLLEKVWINKSSMSKQCRILCQLQINSTKWKFIYPGWKVIFDLQKPLRQLLLCIFFFVEHTSFSARQTEQFVWRV